ncbi:putative UDP-rhamnose:rhamnosyltransferase 1 [Dichanthelium oligosanthes]|uniref:Glycosyltransferase n=1 Tax=Dichanthelium oligosanthes TaxID=888268 RepID=A0A1E5WKN7_9POAL|nr:putative UDP-rhamnose:rhamnosyltransferase 1 [Dichanthelium oligosanthes]
MDATGSSAPSSPARPLRIVLCPWLAFGHMLPYLELAERLASRGHRVSYVSTPRNLARLPPRRHAIDLVPLQLPRVEGLPDGAESTNDVPGDRLEHLWEAFDGLAVPFAEFLAAACADDGGRPDWVLADTFHHWAPTACLKHEVPCAMLQASAAFIAASACGASEREELAAASVFEEISVVAVRPAAIPRYEWERSAALLAPLGASGMSVLRRCSLTLDRCTVVAMRSCPEWELEAFPLAARLLGKPLVPLGLLPPSPDGGRGASANRDHATVRWLDAQPAESVVYVALGSEVPLPVELVHELALGLELAGTRFLWALRKPSGVPDGDVLPAGFLERTHGHGLVTMVWVPQITILAHDAVGAFLTHCGRSSLIEGLLYGHPLVMLPISGDQGPNARLMEGRKVGLQVARDEDDGSFDRHGVASAVRAVMVEEDTRRVFVANAMKMQEIVGNEELQERYVDEFVQQLRSYATDGKTCRVLPSSTAAETY